MLCLASLVVLGCGQQDSQQHASQPAAGLKAETRSIEGIKPNVQGSSTTEPVALAPSVKSSTPSLSAPVEQSFRIQKPDAGVPPDSVAVELKLENRSEPSVKTESLKTDNGNEKVKIRFPARTEETQIVEKPKGNIDLASTTTSLLTSEPPTLTAIDRVSIQPPLQDEGKPNPRTAPLVIATDEEKNQKIAEGWPKPWVSFFVSGQQHGYIEPCGCTGLENQKGGINRRDTLLKSILDRGWEVVPIDAGNQVRRSGAQTDMKFRKSTEALRQMLYQAVAIGNDDLKVSTGDLILAMCNAKGEPESPFVSANLRISDFFPERFKVVEVAGRKIGITSFLGEEFRKEVQQINNADLTLLNAVEEVRKVSQELKKENCVYTILLAHASIKDSMEMAVAVPEFDLVVTAGGFGEPHYKPEPIPGTKSQMVQVGVKGMYAGLVGLYDDPKMPIRYQRIALSSQFSDSPRMLELFKRYQSDLKNYGFERLGIRPSSHHSMRTFVGSEKCGDCHSKAFAIWEKTGHALATEHIVHPPNDRGEIARHFDPECLSCHVTGWKPQEYYPYKSGFASLEQTPRLIGNGCENCHGPGSAHVEAEEGGVSDNELISELRASMRLSLDHAQEKCMECHDMDNSPAFHEDGAFQRYWDEVKHYGKD